MIVGLGIECVEVPRFRAACERGGERLAARLFSRAERDRAGTGAARFQRLAVRFAAKVAAARALGMGAPRFREIEVLREPGGAPTLQLRGACAARAQQLGVSRTSLTLTHDATWCVGQVVLEEAP